MPSDGQPQPCLASPSVRAVLQGQFAAVGFGDLAAKNKADARAAWLGSKERHKKIGGIGKSRTIIENPQLHLPALARPAHLHATFGLERRVGSVANQIDQELLQLIRVGGNDRVWAFSHAYLHARFELYSSTHALRNFHRQQFWLRQSR